MRAEPTINELIEARERGTTKAAPATVTQPAEADGPELVDNGRRLALIEEMPDLSAVQRMRIEEFGTTRTELALERLEDVRAELREAMKIVDTEEDRLTHIAIGEQVDRLDALLDVMRERVR